MDAATAHAMPCRIWHLNFDAEHELARGEGASPASGPRASPTLRAAVSEAARQWMSQMPEGDRTLAEFEASRPRAASAETHLGACWCPTPSAVRRLSQCGLALAQPVPPLAVLQRTNERGFGWSIAPPFPSAQRLHTAADVQAWSEAGAGAWLLKRGFTTAGRQRRPVERGALSEADRAWLHKTLSRGAVYAEPRVDIRTEFSLHGWLAPTGALTRGQPCVVSTTAHGAYAGARPADRADLAPSHRVALQHTFAQVAEALIDAGYAGPFGIDAFLYQEGRHTRLQALSEVNARYTMAWPVGMADVNLGDRFIN